MKPTKLLKSLTCINKGSEKMLIEDDIKKYLEKCLKPSRYVHTLGVVDVAEKLAIQYNVDAKKARIAALLHDAAKNMNVDELIRISKENNHEIDEDYYSSPQLLHGVVGAYIAKNTFDIKDSDILNAITYHTTGRANMCLLEKIIYVADYIEPSRNFQGVESLRELAYKNLDEAVIECCENTIKYILSKKLLLHKNTIEARNYLLIQKQ
ncbi:hypothetical protein U732_1212 [Clostridium argentinense CDC 2741]|uniref:bis(5'-nucleosyl)-tetraphosphatase (symmetrical) n=2 Tax=Clostridium argentinense TaxID=29341 RepID=A0A0C1R1J7_9CLOT|nr:hypothetical protein U732_1212 [Clostridium argentinense CDC 2741]